MLENVVCVQNGGV